MSAVVEPRPTRIRLVLAALCAVLIGLIYVETDQPGFEVAKRVAAPQNHAAAPAGGDDATFAMPPLDSLAEVVRRPLFSEHRRPPATSAAAAADVQSTGFTLVGIVISANGSRALIEHGQPPHLDRVHERQEIDGWTVEKILSDRVVLRHAEDRIEVKVKDAAPPTQQPRAPAAVSPANGPLPARFPGGALPRPPAGRQD